MNQGETSPPSLLTESDLIALMDKHGIGTPHFSPLGHRNQGNISLVYSHNTCLVNDVFIDPHNTGMPIFRGTVEICIFWHLNVNSKLM